MENTRVCNIAAPEVCYLTETYCSQWYFSSEFAISHSSRPMTFNMRQKKPAVVEGEEHLSIPNFISCVTYNFMQTNKHRVLILLWAEGACCRRSNTWEGSWLGT